MVQIFVSKIKGESTVFVDINNPEGATEVVDRPAINEVMRRVKDGRTATIEGDDIHITPDTIYVGGAAEVNIVDVDSVPDDWKPNAFLYDGTTWSTNPNYAKLTATPDI